MVFQVLEPMALLSVKRSAFPTYASDASLPSSVCRKGFGHVLQVNQQLISILEDKEGTDIDLDNAALRVTLDVIGRVGFGKDFGATRDLNSGKANLAFDMMEAGARPSCSRL